MLYGNTCYFLVIMKGVGMRMIEGAYLEMSDCRRAEDGPGEVEF